MTIESSGTTACPHCGGEIKAAAKVCKHCKRPIDASSAGIGAAEDEASAPASDSTFGSVRMLRDLRVFVTGRGVLRPEQFDALIVDHPAVDAAVLLGHIAAAGFVTPMQVEALREGFRQQQESRATAMLRAACNRGLLTPAHCEQALAGYRGVIFRLAIGEYLSTAGMLTATQAVDLQRASTSVGSVSVGLRTWWGGLSASGRRFVFGLAAIPVASVFIYCAILLVGTIRGHADIDESTTMNGWGRGTATFTNRGSRGGSVCGRVFVACGRGSRSSASFCSGSVGPNETKLVAFTVPGTDRIQTYGRDWRDDCEVEFIRESTGE